MKLPTIHEIKKMKDPSEELCLALVKDKWWAINFIKTRTPEICKAAIEQSPHAWNYIEQKDRTPEINKMVIEKDWTFIKKMSITEQTDELCLLAARKGGADVVNHIWNQNRTERLFLKFLENNINIIKYIEDDKWTPKLLEWKVIYEA